MARRAREPDEERADHPLSLSDPKKLQRLYYAGHQLPSPQGGFLEPLRVRPEPDKSATVIFECNTSSLRYALPIPAATRTERRKVKETKDDGMDPNCPRHGAGIRLIRAGAELVCPLCGISYGRV